MTKESVRARLRSTSWISVAPHVAVNDWGRPGHSPASPDQVLRQHELKFYWSRPSLARRSVGGAVNTSWSRCTQRGTEAIVIRLDVTTCAACPVRDQRATAPRSGRQLSL